MSAIIDIANEIHQELGSPNNIAPGLIGYWIRSNIGSLNNLINSSYQINLANGQINPDIGENEKAIFKKQYFIHYYDTKLRDTLNLANSDSVVEVSENGATIRLLNKNEVAKTYISLKKTEQEDLFKMLHLYRMNNASPESVVGADTVEEAYEGGQVDRNQDNT